MHIWLNETNTLINALRRYAATVKWMQHVNGTWPTRCLASHCNSPISQRRRRSGLHFSPPSLVWVTIRLIASKSLIHIIINEGWWLCVRVSKCKCEWIANATRLNRLFNFDSSEPHSQLSRWGWSERLSFSFRCRSRWDELNLTRGIVCGSVWSFKNQHKVNISRVVSFVSSIGSLNHSNQVNKLCVFN